MFSTLSKFTLARALLLKDTPIYVQFYVTARCNLTCRQCNIIYANSDVRECTLDEIKAIADNFAAMKVAMVLLTGGEPFIRQDLPEIIREFESRGIHVRMQTNGLASEEQLHKAVEYGGKDISISLDSLRGDTQDAINGGYPRSWNQALKTIATLTKILPSEKSFASLGCVLQRENLSDVEEVIRFGSAIGWHTSLVPIHITLQSQPRAFQTFDKSLIFKPNEVEAVDRVIERVRSMRDEGYLLYDSDAYLDDIKRFVRREPIQWRDKNDGVCDSPNLYFALLPNGAFAPCCDYRLPTNYFAYDKAFPEIYRASKLRQETREVVGKCAGCMYGSYPEMTISMRYLSTAFSRMKLFLKKPAPKNWPLSYESLIETALRIRNEQRESATRVA